MRNAVSYCMHTRQLEAIQCIVYLLRSGAHDAHLVRICIRLFSRLDEAAVGCRKAASLP